ncbi:potassium-transporting ATPase subunit KdpA [Rubrivivax gelatinosus]|uniref:potassium-transporting ATPase subunit KdpA n=1 Tax=Rubrivivax gelatinosus TaxID=28068 RepID=UPI00031EE268|nr:potassium-transporting ATPase subunit KdpA [Rubrivivax gelatinosus]MBG6081948.1 K+-transporting ATPase ATPase A chain [Rubrivivax gelatinosus]
MSGAWLQLTVFLLVLFAAAWPLGRAIEAVMDGRFALGRRVEAPLFRLAGVDPAEDQPWTRYALGLLVFNGLGLLAVYALQRLQPMLPLNPQDWPAVAPDSALNTAVSFVTNTNWQGYGGETTMSRLTQMLGLAVQNFLSAATGIAVAVALARGFARRTASGIGNVWADLTRATLWILLPLAFVAALFFVSQGVVQTLAPDRTVATVETLNWQQPRLDAAGQPLLDAQGAPQTETVTTTTQTLALGPVASQQAIKLLGTNGGGYFNANSAHPFENPTPLANAVQMLAILLIPAALCFAFGRIVGDARQGWALLGAMTLLFVVAVVAVTQAEYAGNPLLPPLGVDTLPSALQAGGSMEGKEVRFGLDASALFAAVTTAASCGAVNAMHDSLTPLGGAVPLVLMQLGEVVFGGVGSGLYGMLVFALLAVFIAGLMIGRTPEYLGKKIEAHEMKLVSIAILVTPLLVLGGSALAASVDAGRAGILNPGAHGFSEVLYALTSAANNNGSAFAGLSANTPFYNLLLAVAMWLGRFGVLVPVLALAGALAAKPRLAVTRGTLPTHGPLFVALLVGIVLLVGLLNYVPALALGPVAEHLALWAR